MFLSDRGSCPLGIREGRDEELVQTDAKPIRTTLERLQDVAWDPD